MTQHEIGAEITATRRKQRETRDPEEQRELGRRIHNLMAETRRRADSDYDKIISGAISSKKPEKMTYNEIRDEMAANSKKRANAHLYVASELENRNSMLMSELHRRHISKNFADYDEIEEV